VTNFSTFQGRTCGAPSAPWRRDRRRRVARIRQTAVAETLRPMGQTEFDGRCSAPGRARTCRQWRACATTRIQNQCPARARILDYQGDEHPAKSLPAAAGTPKMAPTGLGEKCTPQAPPSNDGRIAPNLSRAPTTIPAGPAPPSLDRTRPMGRLHSLPERTLMR
jgi:hypothetical protein